MAIKGARRDDKVLIESLKAIVEEYRKIENKRFENILTPFVYLKKYFEPFYGKHNNFSFNLITGEEK